MIQKIRTQGFKGFDINETVPQKVIYTGKNKSGKSTRAGAIAIALYGHIPFSTAGKRPGDILDSFGGDSLVCAVTINDIEFARKFSRNSKGGVSQSVQVGGKKTSADNFSFLLGQNGSPKIANVVEFMKQSEAKKIDDLFDLYPNPELATIDKEIEEAKEDVSRLEKKKSGVEATVKRLTNSRQSIEIPSGSIAEVQDEIKNIGAKISELEEQIKQAEIEEAKVKAKTEGQRQEKERAEKEASKKMTVEKETGINIVTESFLPSDDYLSCKTPSSDFYNESQNFQKSFFRQSILKIIGALQGSGCNTCAALIVAKQELKKYKGVS
jgi:DNA repair exonuclease SbcCD ATPase subunit